MKLDSTKLKFGSQILKILRGLAPKHGLVILPEANYHITMLGNEEWSFRVFLGPQASHFDRFYPGWLPGGFNSEFQTACVAFWEEALIFIEEEVDLPHDRHLGVNVRKDPSVLLTRPEDWRPLANKFPIDQMRAAAFSFKLVPF